MNILTFCIAVGVLISIARGAQFAVTILWIVQINVQVRSNVAFTSVELRANGNLISTYLTLGPTTFSLIL